MANDIQSYDTAPQATYLRRADIKQAAMEITVSRLTGNIKVLGDMDIENLVTECIMIATKIFDYKIPNK